MDKTEYDAYNRRRLREKRMRLSSLSGAPETGPGDLQGAGVFYYCRFLEDAAGLDLALKRKHWETADEICDMLLANARELGLERRYGAVVLRLLEEHDV